MNPAPLLDLSVAELSLAGLQSIVVSDLSVAIVSICAVILAFVVLRFAYLLIKNSRVAPIVQIGRWLKLDFRALGNGSMDLEESNKSELDRIESEANKDSES